jgi:hypothetical protein
VFLLEGERNASGRGHERFHAITPEWVLEIIEREIAETGG